VDITGGAIPGAGIPGDAIVGAGEAGISGSSTVTLDQVFDAQTMRLVRLVAITPKKTGAPVLHFSTHNVTVAGQIYEAYIDDITGMADETTRVDSSCLNADITIIFLNDRWGSYTRLSELNTVYPFANAEVVISNAYFDADGNLLNTEQVFRGAIDQLANITLQTFEAPVSSMPAYMDRAWEQAKINKTTWPNAFEDIGSVEPIIYGRNIKAPALRVAWGPRTTLAYGIDAAKTEPTLTTLMDSTKITLGIMLSETDRFSSSGTLTIDDEDISYTSIDNNGNLKGVQRARNSTSANVHSAGATVWIKQTYYDSLLACHQLHSVTAIYAEIGGELVKCLSGISAVYTGGKTLLRATEQIGIDSGLINNLSLDQGSHSHGVSSSATVRYGSSASVASSSTTIQGAAADLCDQSMSTGVLASISGSGSCDLTVNFSTYTGNSATWTVKFYGYYNKGADTDTLTIKIYYQNGGSKTVQIVGGLSLATRGYTCDGIPSKVVISVTAGTGGGTLRVYEVWSEYSVASTSSNPAAGVTLSGSIALVDTWKVDRFHALCNGYASPDAAYGTVGAVIDRPDYVIQHFLRVIVGHAAEEIAADSFASAGAKYASAITGGYAFAFRIADEIKPSDFEKLMAYECRSNLRYVNGQWKLDYINDYIPASSRTVSSGDLCGDGAQFKFSEGSITDVYNDYTGYYGRNYSKLGSETDWTDSVDAAGTADSIARYGTQHKDVNFELIRTAAMVAHVLAHIVVETQYVPLTVVGRMLWQYFALRIGDTFRISNEIYDGRLFYAEKFARAEEGVVELTGRDWWGGVEAAGGGITSIDADAPGGYAETDKAGESTVEDATLVESWGTVTLAPGESTAEATVTTLTEVTIY
jgi:hypothetical protein